MGISGSVHSSSRKAADFAIIALLIILPVATFYAILATAGPSWDIIARYFDGKTLMNFIAQSGSPHALSLQYALAGESLDSLRYYFEPYREPVSAPVFALLSALPGNTILLYMIAVFMAYAAAAWFLGKELGIDRTVMLAALISPYAVYFFFVLNGGEGLAAAFAFIGIVYMLRRSPAAGLFFGIAGIAKYPALILLPMVLLLWNRKKVLIASLLALAPIVAWGIIDGVVWGTPFSSYIQSIQYSNVTAYAVTVSAAAIAAVVAYPAAFAGIGAVFGRLRPRLRLGYREKVVAAFVALSLIGYIAILPHNDPGTQARYGFLFGASLMVAAAMVVGSVVRRKPGVRYIVSAFAVSVLAAMLVYVMTFGNTAHTRYYAPGGANSIYAYAHGILEGLGYGNCRIVSNAWILMLYSGYDAYSPYIMYADGEQARYPAVVFQEVGVQANTTPLYSRLRDMKIAYSDSSLTVYVPSNVSCYSYNET